ncbi:Werner syndrome ATP-dependent helicase [Wickerhamomyces ciferrii]|uniref:Werner syndrome ATP-dependent helicase n=1 Tax=Wickerhamomyces ciferrii (strain ATCC 14091 / BCRC 22168 / CBS 111 / JCM 3599 / NBRC 0793 / NRRL Y-1031 F-60-10) TaxID=1206466 RepID=K0KTH8_WICCF|nr:Werner syndrome ATP-dependent helicase [Wickerhamomyces ciferrii]CCH45317.1 Werner syndrome ATP-dependent helicase [Wickerhamomyces ciferrii]
MRMSDSESDEDSKRRKLDTKSHGTIPNIRIEGRQILQHYEEDLRSDLAVHLYSAHLSHLQDKDFPVNSWTSWPMSRKRVPNPNVLEKYIDEDDLIPRDDPVSKLDGNIIQRNPKKQIPIEEQQLQIENGRDGEDQEEEEVDSESEEDDDDAELQFDREIHALFQRKIQENFVSSKRKIPYELQPTVDDVNLPEHHSSSIKNRLHDMITKFPVSSKSFNRKANFDWKDILFQSGIKDQRLYEKLQTLFVEDATSFLNDFEAREQQDLSNEDSESEQSEGNESDDDESNNAKTNGKGKEDESDGDLETNDDTTITTPAKRYDNGYRVAEQIKANLIRKQIRDKLLEEFFED